MNDATTPAMNPASCETSPGASQPKKKDGRGGARLNTGPKPKRVICEPPKEVMSLLLALAKSKNLPVHIVAAQLLERAMLVGGSL